ncbi:endonuclease domain-containing 1 protein-like [Limanda limanda]|uniref:endonuclease domain-containing 1 protein-like n=1 Tax=Limanda limanda TaxID=27771 RepID=UPI0029C788C1|nr:endonuclease domain-containing 1 protein-like [Limanda limanda]
MSWCLFKYSTRLKRFPHASHPYGGSPVWNRWCRSKLPRRLKVRPHYLYIPPASCKRSQRKMLQFSTGALLLLLPWFGGLVLGEVSSDFSKCLKFFYNRSPPQGINTALYQPICQRYKNQYHFASLYNREHRTPLYSAYTLGPADGGRPKILWMYEPQLVSPSASTEMTPFKQWFDKNVFNTQAVLQDYCGSGFTKGHLNPSMHQKTKENREATFTLTNIVPQKKSSNNGPWSRLESEVKGNFTVFCKGPMYVITGALPYLKRKRLINNRVSVPEYMWSAYCCPSYKSEPNPPFLPTYAAVGRNDPDSGEEVVKIDQDASPSVKGYDVKRMSLTALEVILRQRLRMPEIILFDGQCRK